MKRGLRVPRSLASTTTRPLRMTWENLAFLHWPVPVSSLRPLVHPQLDIETFDGTAWVGVVPFQMRDIRVLRLPAIPTATRFPELNVRTYVRHKERRGVWFFSLDAASWLAVLGAKAWTGLPYHHARMRVVVGDRDIGYSSHRTGLPDAAARFEGSYRPIGGVFRSAPGSFEHWCTEVRTLYSVFEDDHMPTRVDVEHEPWPLQRASANIATNTVAAASNIQLPDTKPHVLFCKHLDVFAHWPRRPSEPLSWDIQYGDVTLA